MTEPSKPQLTTDDCYDLQDLLPKDMILWGDDEELDWWPDDPWTLNKWRRILGHELKHPGCCAKCGCAGSCDFGVFYDGVVTGVIRELNKLGLIRQPTEASGDEQ